MSLLSEEFKSSVNTLEEVKKLQELVRKLEIQNLHLRNKQNNISKKISSPVKEINSFSSPRLNHKFSGTKSDIESSCTKENRVGMKDEYFDELDIIRVSDIEMSDDESWLYTSTKSVKHDESPYKWLRKDVDDPENKQLQLAKNALLSKLNELDILSPPSKTSSLAENRAVSNLKKTQILYKSLSSAQTQDSVQIDTRTFTRSKKKQAIEFLEKLDVLNNDKSNKNCSSMLLHRKGSDVSSDSISSCHILEDASDVEEVARLQEESLRMNSPLGTPKRALLGHNVSSRKISTSSRGSISDQDLSENSCIGATTPEDSSGYEVMENIFCTVDILCHSDQPSPSESPYSSNVSLHSSEKVQGKLSGNSSLPNLNREPLVARQSKVNPNNSSGKQNQIKSISGRKTDKFIQNNQRTRKEYTSPLRVKNFNQSPPISGCQTTSIENVTPVPRNVESARLRARSGLPRPSRASSASRTSARSGIPMPSMLSKRQVEDSWSEGCF